MKKKLLLTLVVSVLLVGCGNMDAADNAQETEAEQAQEVQTQEVQEQEEIHAHTYVENITTEATCEANGLKTFTCECGDSYTEVITAVGHSYEEVAESTTPATCGVDGLKTFTCKCGDSYTEVITATEHNYEEVADSAAPATCDTDGKEADRKCSLCGSIEEGAVIAAIGHSYGEYVYNNDATTSADGTETASCSVCGSKTSRPKVGTRVALESFPYELNVLYNDGRVGYFYCIYDEYEAAFGDGFHDTTIGKLCDEALRVTTDNMAAYDSKLFMVDNNTFPSGYDKDVYVGEYAEGTIWKYTAYVRYQYLGSGEIYVWH